MLVEEFFAGGFFVEINEPHHRGMNSGSIGNIRTAARCSGNAINESDDNDRLMFSAWLEGAH